MDRHLEQVTPARQPLAAPITTRRVDQTHETLRACDDVLNNLVRQRDDISTLVKRVEKGKVELRPDLAIKQRCYEKAIHEAGAEDSVVRRSVNLVDGTLRTDSVGGRYDFRLGSLIPGMDCETIVRAFPAPNSEDYVVAVCALAAFDHGSVGFDLMQSLTGLDTAMSFIGSRGFKKRVDIIKEVMNQSVTKQLNKQEMVQGLSQICSEMIMKICASLSPEDLINLKQTSHRMNDVMTGIMSDPAFAVRHLLTPINHTAPLYEDSSRPVKYTIGPEGCRGLNASLISPRRPLSALPDTYFDALILVAGLTHPLLGKKAEVKGLSMHERASDSVSQIYDEDYLCLNSANCGDNRRIVDSINRCLELENINEACAARFIKTAFFSASADNDAVLLTRIIDLCQSEKFKFDHEHFANFALYVAFRSGAEACSQVLAPYSSPEALIHIGFINIWRNIL